MALADISPKKEVESGQGEPPWRMLGDYAVGPLLRGVGSLRGWQVNQDEVRKGGGRLEKTMGSEEQQASEGGCYKVRCLQEREDRVSMLRGAAGAVVRRVSGVLRGRAEVRRLR